MVAPGASWMPIGELSRRVGVSSDLLRKWERRYGVLTPGRTVGNRRLYSRVDEARLRVMLGHVRQGVPPAQAAELASAARFRVAPNAERTASVDRAVDARAQLQAALERFDETAAEQVLEKLLATATVPTIMRDVLLPFMNEVGERWEHARVSVAQEHFASAFVHSRLLGLSRGWDRGLGSRAVLACPSGEQHTLGLIMFGIALHQLGWRITYLGADTPLPMVAQAAAAVHPQLIVLAVAIRSHLPTVADDLRALAEQWPVCLGGAGATPQLADTCGARHLAADPVTAANEFLS